MTATPTHQPVAYQIEDAKGEFMCLSRTKSTVRGVTSKPLYDESALEAERTARIAAQVENEALRAELAKARTPLEDYEWLEYILRNGSKSDVHIATYEGVATTGPRGKIIRLQHDANNLRKLVEAAYGIGEKP